MKHFVQMLTLLVATAATRAANYQCQTTVSNLWCLGSGISQPPSGYWPKIETLRLSNTSIAVLYTNSLSGFPYVHQLYLENTPLTVLDLEVQADMLYLDSLHLRNNSIQAIVPAPSGVELDHLRQVFLNDNNITWLDPLSFEAAPNLEYLILTNNPIIVPEGKAVLKHPKLVYIQMQHGTLNLGPESFKDLPLLREVSLISSGITNITGAFVTNTKLQEIEIVNNSISEVTAGTFAPSGHLSSLNLKGNPLERLEIAAVRDAMAESGSIIIDDSPLACACNYEALYWWAQSRRVNIHATCDDIDQCFF